MNSLALFFFMLAILCFCIGYTKSYKECPKPIIKYKYIPKNFEEQHLTLPNLKKKYIAMFNDKSIWLNYPIN